MGKRFEETFLQTRYTNGMWKYTQHHQSLQKCKSKPQWDTTSPALEGQELKQGIITHVDNNVEKLVLSYTVARNVKWWTQLLGKLGWQFLKMLIL